jgi:hypothetical protein
MLQRTLFSLARTRFARTTILPVNTGPPRVVTGLLCAEEMSRVARTWEMHE